MPNFQTADKVRITVQGRTEPGEILLASPNGVSLMLQFEAILDGHVGMMPVLRDRNGIYHSIVTGSEVTIEPAAPSD